MTSKTLKNPQFCQTETADFYYFMSADHGITLMVINKFIMKAFLLSLPLHSNLVELIKKIPPSVK